MQHESCGDTNARDPLHPSSLLTLLILQFLFSYPISCLSFQTSQASSLGDPHTSNGCFLNHFLQADVRKVVCVSIFLSPHAERWIPINPITLVILIRPKRAPNSNRLVSLLHLMLELPSAHAEWNEGNKAREGGTRADEIRYLASIRWALVSENGVGR